MGIETVVLLATAAKAASDYKTNKEVRKAQKEEQEIASANAKVQERRQLRAKAREERIRRAQLEQASINTGVSSSSGELGALGNLSAASARTQAFLASSEATADALTSKRQEQADSLYKGQIRGGLIDIASTGYQVYDNIFNS